jgi:GNAT superfamily N-acetyltransferase
MQSWQQSARPVPSMTTLKAQICTLPPAELSTYCAHLLRLDRESRHARFGWAMDDTGIRTQCLRIVAQGVTVIVARVDDVVRAGIEIWPASQGHAEIVFSVESGWRNRGVASSLINAAISEAKTRNIHWLEMEYDDFDPIVLHLIEKFGGSLHGSAGVRGRIGAWQIKPPTTIERQTA